MATMIPVDSSNLAAVGYDPEAEIVTVEFKNGAVWEYGGIRPSGFDRLLCADSPGSYLRKSLIPAATSGKRIDK
jgi:hypothetical protein